MGRWRVVQRRPESVSRPGRGETNGRAVQLASRLQCAWFLVPELVGDHGHLSASGSPSDSEVGGHVFSGGVSAASAWSATRERLKVQRWNNSGMEPNTRRDKKKGDARFQDVHPKRWEN